MKRIITLSIIAVITGNFLLQAQAPRVVAGRVLRIEHFRSNFVTPRNIDIWLPPDYKPGRKYPVLYMHDGQMLYDAETTWNKQEWGVDETISRLIEEKKIPPVIVVGIWNSGSGRHADYFPRKPFESMQDWEKELVLRESRNHHRKFLTSPIQSDNYLKFIVKELKPFIDKHYSTHRDRANTFIAGSSMGGLISMYAVCEYPKVFGGAACLSTHWPGVAEIRNNPLPNAFCRYLDKRLPAPKHHKFYFDYGTETLDALYEPYQRRVDSVFITKKYTDKHWDTIKFEGKDHSENAWSERLEIPLLFLLGKGR
jgi:enterochelin esterase-like enzyme